MSNSNSKFYWESRGECISQVYEIKEAKTWEEAQNLALELDEIDVGDYIAECHPDAVIQEDNYPDYYFINHKECKNFAVLCEDDNEYYFSDDEYYLPER